MTTNPILIGDALREINVINEVQVPSAEQGKQALRKLNQMMELWKEDSLDVGWFKQTTTTDTAPIPDYAEVAVTLALAVFSASKFGKSVSQETAVTANDAIKVLRRKIIVEGLDNTDMTHLAIGSGRYGSGYNILTDN